MRLRILLLISTLMVYPVGTLHAQDNSSNVVSLYFASVAYPEDFDTSFELLEATVDESIQSCVVRIRNTYFQLAKITMDQCKAAHGGDPNMEWKCLKDDPSASLAKWAEGMVQLIRKETSSWRNTFTGSNMLMAKRLAGQISPGSWVQMVKMGMPYIRQMIICP